MLSKNADGSFAERPEYKAERAWLCVSFLVKIVERLLHRLSKPRSEPMWIQGKQFPVKSMNEGRFACHT